jgi:hypothetical protein
MAVAYSPRRPPPSVKSRFASSGLKKPFLPPFLEGVVDNLTLALTFACSRIWSPPMSVELAPSRHGRGRVKRSLPQQRGDCYAGAQLSGKPLGTVGGAGRLYAGPHGVRLATSSSGLFRGEAARGTRKPLAVEVGPCVSRVVAAIMARSG